MALIYTALATTTRRLNVSMIWNARPNAFGHVNTFGWRIHGFNSVKSFARGRSFVPMIHHTTKNIVSSSVKNICSSFRNSFSSLTFCGSTVFGITILAKFHFCQKVSCQGRSRLHNHVQEDSVLETKFPWKEFFKLLLPDIWYLIGAVLSALAVAFINIEIPLLLGGLVNVLAKHAAPNASQCDFLADIKQPALKLILMYCAQGLLTTVYISLLSAMAEKLAARMRQRLFESLIIQDIAFFDANKTGELVNRLTSDVQDFKSSMKMCISQGLRSITQTLGCMVSMCVVSPKLTGLMVAVVGGMISIGSLMGSGLRKLSREAQAQIAKSTGVADEALGNVRTVRAFAMEQTEIGLFNQEVEKSSHLNQLLGVGIGVFQGLSNVALNGLVLGTLYVGGYLMSLQEVSAGDLMSFMVATQTIQRSLAQVSMLFGQAVRGVTAGSRVFEYMALQPLLPIKGGKIIPYHSLFGNVEFKQVNFTYPARPDHQVLTDFNLMVKGGRMVALVGLSGSGKSTVAALLERFYDVSSGSITLDGHDIKTLDPSWLRGRVIGFINQEPVLFATTVMENIRYGRPDASDTEVIEAARLANADDFITRFPSGYQTVLGERGVTISGGQKQRIAIARALLKNPSVLILDEATSALDAESERVVQEALDHAVKGRTVLVIAHRLSTVRNADVIAVVSDGRIVEMGTHDELRKRKGFYWQLIRSQEHQTQGLLSGLFGGAQG